MTNIIIGLIVLYALFGYWLDRKVTSIMGHDYNKKPIKPVRALIMPILIPTMIVTGLVKRTGLRRWLQIFFGNLTLLYPRKRTTFATRSIISRVRLIANAYLRLPNTLGDRADLYLFVKINKLENKLEREAAKLFVADELETFKDGGGLVN